jgi:uncharacterized protein involved in exopolysaccharide biosynthesis
MQREGGEWRRDLAAVGADLRPRYSLSEWTGLLWRERVLMAVVFALVFALGAAGALLLPKTYVARSSLLVRAGQDYVDQPQAAGVARGAVPQTFDGVPSEVEILSSDELKRRGIRAVGLQALDPRLASAWANAADGAERNRIMGAAVRMLTLGLKIDAAPDAGVVRLSVQHPNPQTAAAVLNALVDSYLTYRHDVLSDRDPPLLAQEKAAFEARLARADAAYEAFQVATGVGDLPSEKASLAVLRESVLDQRFRAEADLSAAQSRLAALTRSLQTAPAEIEIQRDLDLSASGKLLQLRLERRDLLSRYKPNAAPVREVDARIAELEACAASPSGATEKDRRLGANPVRQDLERQRVAADADLAAAARRRDELSRQLDEIAARQRKLTGLETRYQDLSVERDVLQANLRAFAQREAEAHAAQALAHGGDGGVRVVERASAPVEGTSLRGPMFALAVVLAAFAAACAGLMRVVLRRGFVTPEAAGRVLDLPVLACAPLKVT